MEFDIFQRIGNDPTFQIFIDIFAISERRIARKWIQFWDIKISKSKVLISQKIRLGERRHFPFQITNPNRIFLGISPTLPRNYTYTRVRGPRYVSWRSVLDRENRFSFCFSLSFARVALRGSVEMKGLPRRVGTDITHQLGATNRSLAGNYADYTRFLWLQREPTGLRATLAYANETREGNRCKIYPAFDHPIIDPACRCRSDCGSKLVKLAY